MEIEKEVKTFVVDYICDKCSKGKMIPTGICLTTSPSQYPHKCNQCNYIETFRTQYPYHHYKRITF